MQARDKHSSERPPWEPRRVGRMCSRRTLAPAFNNALYYIWQLQGRGPAYILVIHRLVVISIDPIVLAASRTTRVDLRTWSHIICGINDTNRAFRKVEITCILVACTSLGILMTRSLSGVRVNPLQRSTVVSWVVFILWMCRASSRRLIAHIIHICSTERPAFK